MSDDFLRSLGSLGSFGNLRALREQLQRASDSDENPEDKACFLALGKLRKIARHREASRFERHAALVSAAGTFNDHWPTIWEDGPPQVTFCQIIADAAGRILQSKSVVDIASIYETAIAKKPARLDTRVLDNAALALKGITEDHLLVVARQQAKERGQAGQAGPANTSPTGPAGNMINFTEDDISLSSSADNKTK